MQSLVIPEHILTSTDIKQKEQAIDDLKQELLDEQMDNINLGKHILLDMWNDFREKYCLIMENVYTNWNAGLTKDGKSKTYEYQYDRKITVAYSDVEKDIDESLCSGKFDVLDDLYIKIINGTCRHLGHSGPNGYPSKKIDVQLPKKWKMLKKPKH